MLLCLAFLLGVNCAEATDFQIPPSVAAGDVEGAKSKKSLVSKGTFRLLEDVQKTIDKGEIDIAFQKLNTLIIRVQETPYETAVVLKNRSISVCDERTI